MLHNCTNYNIAVFVLLIKYPMKGERLSRETNFRGELHLENKDGVSTISCRNISFAVAALRGAMIIHHNLQSEIEKKARLD